MNKHALHHEPKSKYAYAYKKDVLHIRFRSAKDDLKKVQIVAFDPYSYIPIGNGQWQFDLSKRFFIDMHKEHSDDLFDYWFGAVDCIDTLRIRYAFVLNDGISEQFYGPYMNCSMTEYEAIAEIGHHYFNFPYINEEDVYEAPSWVEDTIWYQIFPERFNRSEDGPEIQDLMAWNQVTHVSNDMVFGGNLKGIIEKLDYIKALGISGIYFTPIFESPSTHKYDTTDYFKIDPAFGSNEMLGLLVEEAHKRDIKVMLDGVFNHCGYYHPFWQDVLKHGKASKYYDCFYIEDEEISIKESQDVFSEPTDALMRKLNYRIFGTALNMPKWKTSNDLVREHLIEVGQFWIEKYDIDGWRLDVSNEVSHDFWRAFRKAIKAVKKDVYIIGENWDNSNPWLTGDQFDAVMNYELLSVIWNFIGVQDIREKYDAKKFADELGKYMINYPKHVVSNMFNMVDSHDTARVLTVSGKDIKKAMLIYLLQFIMPGSPSLMYGSEIGLQGNFESARGCMVFDDKTESHPLYTFLNGLIHLRKANKVFRSLDYKIIWVDQEKNSLCIEKTQGQDVLSILINNSPSKHNYLLHDQLVEVQGFGYYMTLNKKRISL